MSCAVVLVCEDGEEILTGDPAIWALFWGGRDTLRRIHLTQLTEYGVIVAFLVFRVCLGDDLDTAMRAWQWHCQGQEMSEARDERKVSGPVETSRRRPGFSDIALLPRASI